MIQTIKLAIFDVDGTLYDGNLGMELVKALIKEGVFTERTGNIIFSLYNEYIQGIKEKSIIVDAIYQEFAKGLTNTSTSEIKRISENTFASARIRLFPFANELISSVRNRGFEIILLTGSPTEMINILATSLGIPLTNIIAGVTEVIDETYTGRVISYPGSAEQKVSALHNWMKNQFCAVDWVNSIAFGDNERDIGIFSLVGSAFAVNPNESLRQFSNTKTHIQICDEEKLMDIVMNHFR